MSSNQPAMQGTQVRHTHRRQHSAPATLERRALLAVSSLPSSLLRGLGAYICMPLPSLLMLVMALVWQNGQSMKAGSSPSMCSGVTVAGAGAGALFWPAGVVVCCCCLRRVGQHPSRSGVGEVEEPYSGCDGLVGISVAGAGLLPSIVVAGGSFAYAGGGGWISAESGCGAGVGSGTGCDACGSDMFACPLFIFSFFLLFSSSFFFFVSRAVCLAGLGESSAGGAGCPMWTWTT